MTLDKRAEPIQKRMHGHTRVEKSGMTHTPEEREELQAQGRGHLRSRHWQEASTIFSSLLEQDEEDTDALIVNVGGDTSNGAVVGTNHQATRPRGLTPGETMIYNGPAGTSMYLASGQIVVNANGQPVSVNGATVVTIVAANEIVADTPLLKCKGDILDNYETNTRTMAGMRQVANGHTHKVVNVQTGGSTIETNAPDQEE